MDGNQERIEINEQLRSFLQTALFDDQDPLTILIREEDEEEERSHTPTTIIE